MDDTIETRTRTRRLTLFSGAIAMFAALLLAAAPAVAGTPIAHTDTGIVLELPDGWTGRGGDVISVSNEDDTGFIYFWADDYGKVENGVKGLESELGTFLEGVRVKDDDEDGEINGMEVRYAKGTAKVGDFKVVWEAAVINTPNRIGFLLGFAGKESWKEHKSAYESVLKSIKKSGAAE